MLFVVLLFFCVGLKYFIDFVRGVSMCLVFVLCVIVVLTMLGIDLGLLVLSFLSYVGLVLCVFRCVFILCVFW
jgi:hypothetical protein